LAYAYSPPTLPLSTRGLWVSQAAPHARKQSAGWSSMLSPAKALLGHWARKPLARRQSWRPARSSPSATSRCQRSNNKCESVDWSVALKSFAISAAISRKVSG